MASVPSADPALLLTIGLLNTYNLLDDEPDHLSASVAAGLAAESGMDALAMALSTLDRREVDRLRTVRSRLYVVFAAIEPEAKISALNAVIDEANLRPRVVGDADGVRLVAARVSTRDDPVGDVQALAADALASAMMAGGPRRFGTCAGDPCRCVYVDRTRSGRQRFCSQLCNDRMAAAAYRSRRAAT